MSDKYDEWSETERLAALHRTELLDTPPEQAFDDLVQAAARLLRVPMAAIHFVDATRQWGKAEIGLGVREIPRELAFCPHAMTQEHGLIVPDTQQDARFSDNPLVTGAPGIRFYAGMPLEAEGLPIGALCVIDTEPHANGLTDDERFILKTLAVQTSSQIALRTANRRQRELIEERDNVLALLNHERNRVEAELRAANDALETRVAERSAELAASEEQLRQSLKMEAVGQLTGGLAHDFNNLLTAISGSLELIELRLAQGRVTDANRHLIVASSSVDRAASLTHRLLAFSRRQTLDPKPVLLNRLISGVEDMLRRSIGPAIELEVVGAGGLWIAKCDPNQLENALLNLCLNARDAMPTGGKLTIETANASLDTYAARARSVPRGQFVVMSVTDTGVGMPPDVLDHVFEPFFTTKPIGQGTGLGLSMVYGFVRQSGGEARIYSEVGQGTTVKIYLPRHHGEEETDDALPIHQAVDAGGGQTVLFVDDEPAIREIAGEVLQEIGCAHLEASDGVSAMRLLESGAKIDLLITDVGLPRGMNGRQLAEAARAIIPDLKVLFVTGFAENAVLGNGILGLGMQVMTKPFSLEAFALRVRELLNSQ